MLKLQEKFNPQVDLITSNVETSREVYMDNGSVSNVRRSIMNSMEETSLALGVFSGCCEKSCG